MDNICKIEKCDRSTWARGLCSAHYKRYRRNGFKSVSTKPLKRVELHGKSRHPLYRAWGSMIARCNNPSHTSYKSYGGRGIKVCDRWRSFPSFLEDVGERPTPAHQLDRVDNNGNYSPDNVKWSTPAEQAWNRRENPRNTSGYTGVSYQKYQNTWRMTFERNGVRVRSTHETKEGAVEARIQAERDFLSKH